MLMVNVAPFGVKVCVHARAGKSGMTRRFFFHFLKTIFPVVFHRRKSVRDDGGSIDFVQSFILDGQSFTSAFSFSALFWQCVFFEFSAERGKTDFPS